MPSFFDYQRQKKLARDFYDQYGREEGEVTDPEGRAFLERYYQEPTASPILERGALSEQLAAVDSLKRQLMARGMNRLQAEDAANAALEQEEAQLDRTAQSIATLYGPGSLYGTGEGSYEDYSRSQIPEPKINEFPEPPPEPEDWGKQQLSLEDWSKQRAMARRDASGVSAESKARYEEQTVDDRIDIIKEQAAALPVELEAKGVSHEVTTKLMTEVFRLLDLAIQEPENAATHAQQAQNLFSVVKAKSGSAGFSSYTADQFISDAVDQSQAQGAAQGATVGQEGGQQLIAPRQTHIEGEYRR